MKLMLFAWGTVVVASWLWGCGSSPQREACYADAHLELKRKSDERCPGEWSTCPEREALLDEHLDRQGACP